MKLTKYRLGDFVELYNEKCGNADLTAWDISGVNSDESCAEQGSTTEQIEASQKAMARMRAILGHRIA